MSSQELTNKSFDLSIHLSKSLSELIDEAVKICPWLKDKSDARKIGKALEPCVISVLRNEFHFNCEEIDESIPELRGNGDVKINGSNCNIKIAVDSKNDAFSVDAPPGDQNASVEDKIKRKKLNETDFFIGCSFDTLTQKLKMRCIISQDLFREIRDGTTNSKYYLVSFELVEKLLK